MSPQPIRADSPRRAHARRFGLELDRAVRLRGVSLRSLAVRAGVSRSLLYFYREGVSLPTLEAAGRLAEELDCRRLVAIAEEARSGTCELCARAFTSTAGAGNRRFCSDDCRRIAYEHRTRKRPARDRAVRAERTAARHVAAVDAFCRACEPDGACRTPECPLRVVSPLPLARGRVA
jgi:transcriptional regulator with XRE-family HTH domain